MNKKTCCSAVFLLICFASIVSECLTVGADPNTCKPSGKIRGPKPPKACNHQGSECCKQGELYDIYKCSPPVSNRTEAILTLLTFGNEDSRGPTECDGKFHSDKELVVALSTGWLNKKERCNRLVKIYGNGKRAKAKVVDECDSTIGCDADNDYRPPCDNNIVDASVAVWEALGVPEDQRDRMDIHWADA